MLCPLSYWSLGLGRIVTKQSRRITLEFGGQVAINMLVTRCILR